MRIAIVEDDERESSALSDKIKRYARSNGIEITTEIFSDAIIFLSRFDPGYDAVFMDIDMPDLSGMDAAKKMRERDPVVPLIFVTAWSSFAVEGYSVGACDYLVKPYSYEALLFSMDRLLSARTDGGDVVVRNLDGFMRIPVDSIYYVEVNKHRVLYHTDSGITDVWGSMKSAEKGLSGSPFARCGVSYLINLRNVTAIDGDEVTVGGDRIKISRAYKRGFIAALNLYISGGMKK